MTTVIDSDFRRRDAEALMEYLEHEDQNLRDRTGREMNADDHQRFLDRSREHEMSRHLIISPENANRLDIDGIERATRKTVRETIGRREGVAWGYTVHTDGGDRPHAHVVATGRADHAGDPLWIDTDDLDHIRERAHEHCLDQERGVEHALDEALEASIGRAQEQTQEHDCARDDEVEQRQDRLRDPEPERGADR